MQNQQYEISSNRLRLRPFQIEDIPELVEMANNLQIAQMVSSLPHPYTLADAHDWLDTHDALRLAGISYPFAVHLKNGALIGVIGLDRPDPAGLYNLGYWLGQAYWGNGYASEAAIALVKWAKDQLGIRVVLASHFEDNPASGKVLSKVGFLRTGTTQMITSKARPKPVQSMDMIWMG